MHKIIYEVRKFMNSSSQQKNKEFKYSIKDELFPMLALHTLKNRKNKNVVKFKRS